jgi:hypothetical protein
MANPVNPPPQLRIPMAFLKDPEVAAFVEQQNIILFQLYRKLGGVNDPISNIGNEGITSFAPLLQQTIKQLNGLPEFTIDTSGFTTDLTFITTDKVIA